MMSWVNGRKCENLLNILQFNTSWLASIRTWYFALASCLAVTLHFLKKRHTLSFSSFFLLLVTVVAQFTAKTTNSEKAIYFVSLLSCSINSSLTHYSHEKVSRKFYLFNVEKTFLLQEIAWAGGKAGASQLPPFSTALIKYMFLLQLMATGTWWMKNGFLLSIVFCCLPWLFLMQFKIFKDFCLATYYDQV